MLSTRQITDKDLWEQFNISQPFSLFTQSKNYGTFYELLGEKSWVYGVYEGNKLIAGALVVSTHAKRGNFLFIPYGPVILPEATIKMQAILSILTETVKKLAKDYGYAFIRMSPFIVDNPETRMMWKNTGHRDAPIHALAETTWLLDVTPDEDTLLMAMNKNHRNLIRRCQKEGVRVEIKHDRVALDEFNTLHDTTAARHQFHRFSKDYITKEFQALAPDYASIFHTYLPDGTLDASAIIVYYGTMAAYRHGASLGRNSKIPSSYLLQWEAIKEAKRRGMRWYNFWGIAPDNASKKHPFVGITHFKKGFGGEQKNVIPCQDFPISLRYYFTWIIETIRRRKRGF